MKKKLTRIIETLQEVIDDYEDVDSEQVTKLEQNLSNIEVNLDDIESAHSDAVSNLEEAQEALRKIRDKD